MKKKAPTGVGEILEGIKQSTHLGLQLQRAKIWERWPEVAGPGLCGHGQPKSIRDKRLTVEAESPVWMHRFAMRKWDLIKRINAMAGEELVSDVFVVLRDDEPPPTPPDAPEKTT